MKKLLVLTMFAFVMACASSTKITRRGEYPSVPGSPEMTLRGEYPSAPDGKMIYISSGSEYADSVEVKNGKFVFPLEGAKPGEYLIVRTGPDGGREALLIYLDNYDTHVTLTDETYKVSGFTFIRAAVTGNPTNSAVREVVDMVVDQSRLNPLNDPELHAKLVEIAERGDLASAIVMWKFGSMFTGSMTPDQLQGFLDGLSEDAKQSEYGKAARESISDFLAATPD